MRKFLLCLPLFLLTGCGKEAASIGIIGGADGPTAIMLTGGFPWGLLIGGFALGLIAGILWKRKKK